MRTRTSLAWVTTCLCFALAFALPAVTVAGVVAPPPDDEPVVDPASDCDDPAAPFECADEVPDSVIVTEPTNAPDCDGLDDPFVCADDTDDGVIEAGDRDNDGLDDATEAMIGTNPDKQDTDGDGLGDGSEYIYPPGVDDGCATRYDCDGDGLSDGEEAVLGTSYLDTDSDDDKVGDGVEVQMGKDPLDPTDQVTPEAPAGQLTMEPTTAATEEPGMMGVQATGTCMTFLFIEVCVPGNVSPSPGG